MVDHWMRDEHSESCVDRKVKFTIYERKHHCRNCGKVFCSSCSQYQAEIPRLKIMQPVRVCKPCHIELINAKSTTKHSSNHRPSSRSSSLKKTEVNDVKENDKNSSKTKIEESL